jgi:hypothetical protein
MPGKGKQNLYRAIDRMPRYQPPEGVWAGIERALDAQQDTEAVSPAAAALQCAAAKAAREAAARENEAVLRRAVRQLPPYALPADVFDQIAGDPARPGREATRGYWRAGIAASVALLMAVGWWFAGAGPGSERVQVAYSEETIYIPQAQPELAPPGSRAEVLQFVLANCTPAVLPCQTSEFKGLLVQYQELEAARKELEAQIRAHREQPQLVRYLVRVEKQQTEVGKRLIQHLRI